MIIHRLMSNGNVCCICVDIDCPMNCHCIVMNDMSIGMHTCRHRHRHAQTCVHRDTETRRHTQVSQLSDLCVKMGPSPFHATNETAIAHFCSSKRHWQQMHWHRKFMSCNVTHFELKIACGQLCGLVSVHQQWHWHKIPFDSLRSCAQLWKKIQSGCFAHVEAH